MLRWKVLLRLLYTWDASHQYTPASSNSVSLIIRVLLFNVQDSLILSVIGWLSFSFAHTTSLEPSSLIANSKIHLKVTAGWKLGLQRNSASCLTVTLWFSSLSANLGPPKQPWSNFYYNYSNRTCKTWVLFMWPSQQYWENNIHKIMHAPKTIMHILIKPLLKNQNSHLLCHSWRVCFVSAAPATCMSCSLV